MTQDHIHTKEFIVGAAVGSLLGSVAALLMAPKSGKRLRQDLNDMYCDLSDSTCDLTRKGKYLARSVGNQACDWTGKAKGLVDGAKKSLCGLVSCEEECEEEGTRDLIIGGVAGSVLGAAIALLLAPKSGDKFRQDIVDTYEDAIDRTQDYAQQLRKKGRGYAKKAQSKTNKWLAFAKEAIDGFTDEVEDRSEDLTDAVKKLIPNEKIHELLDWADLGYRLWQGVKSRR